MMRTDYLALLAIFLAPAAPLSGQLKTRWAKDVTADNCHPEYPRPHLVRGNWQNLNGLWDYAVTASRATEMGKPQGNILVPFPIESALSGVKQQLPKDHVLWYRRRFRAPELASGEALRLNFGAVDWRCEVFVNGKSAGTHQGGYDAFSFDISAALVDRDEQELVVRVEDPTSDDYQPRGKQVRNPKGIWYTPSSGIWQTVWLERVPRCYVREVYCLADIAKREVTAVIAVPEFGATIKATASAGGKEVCTRIILSSKGGVFRVPLPIPEPRLWNPKDPFLYDLDVRVESGGQVDTVRSYFGMREIEVAKDGQSVNRLFLNGSPLFQLGPLDQGFWPDGLYTAPTDAALRYDLEQTKALGFNMVRKHVKIEPERWYYHCDRLGLMVWQDMPSGDKYIGSRAPDHVRTEESSRNFYRELGALIDGRRQHPCIVAWVPFNEGWGQFDTNRVLAWVAKRDPTRLVDGPSGWTDRGTGDMHDIHRYPGPAMPKLEERRAAVLGEFGGLGLPIEGHLWWNKRNWGYRNFKDRASLQAAYEGLMRRLRRDYARGLAAAVYTQTTDVEGEVNGLMTYDREILKLDTERVRRLHEAFYAPPPVFSTTTVLPTSERRAQTWRYTFAAPRGDWWRPGFDDDSWKQGPGGFGRKNTPGAMVRTAWTGSDIWLRKSFVAEKSGREGLHLRIHHDEDARIYLNGHGVAYLEGYTRSYVEVPAADLARHLVAGENHIAVHCHQTGGGQFIDVGIVAIEERERK